MKIKVLKEKIYNWISNQPYIPYIILGLAGLIYSGQAWIFSHQQKTLLDEGNYLLKGYLFTIGRYVPYQDFGPWTNKMPLAFLVPGIVQRIFGPGFSTGRYYAFALTILILILAVIIGIRLGGRWGGVITAGMMALNPAPLKIYTMVLTEGLIVFLLLLVLIFILGNDRPLWQILVGSFLAGLIPVTRINLLPVLPLVVFYLFWEHGYKKGVFSLLVSLIPFIGLNALYWPGIFRLWAKWIPGGYFDFVDAWKNITRDSIQLREPELTILDRFMAFSQGIRLQFPALIGVFSAICLWPKEWLDRNRQRIAIFLLILFTTLFIVHLAAPAFLDFNIHAFFRYICAFNVLGILLVALTWKEWNFNQSNWKQILIGVGIVINSLFIGYSVSEESSFYGTWIKGLLLRIASTLEGGKLMIASRNWWEVIQGRFEWEFSSLLRVAAVGLSVFIAAVFLVGLMFLYKRFLLKNQDGLAQTLIPYALVFFLAFGTLISPTGLLGGGYHFYDCPKGNIKHYQEASSLISKYVKEGDQVYWVGKDTQILLLDLIEEKNIQIYPQQLNSVNSFRLNGNPEELARHGFWNDALAKEWVDGSQVLLFEEQALSGWFSTIYPQLNLEDFEKVAETSNLGCSFSQRIYIYRR